MAVVGCAAVVRLIQYHGDAKPGVHVLGVDVGGRDRAQIETALRVWGDGRVTIHAAGRSYHVRRGWLVAIDAPATAKRALAAGSLRRSSRRTHRRGAGPRACRRRAERARADRARRPPGPVGGRPLNGTHAVVTPGRYGRSLDHAALLRLLADRETVIEAPFARITPDLRTAAAQVAATTIDTLLARPLVDRLPRSASWSAHARADRALHRGARERASVRREARRRAAREGRSPAARKVDRACAQRAVRGSRQRRARRAVAARSTTSTRRSS